MSRCDVTDDELEAVLRERAAARGYRFDVERTVDGSEWKAVFKADPLPGQKSFAQRERGA